MKVTYLSHMGFIIEFNGKKLLFDPFITGNPKPGPIKSEDISPDWILVSHGHGDHVADVEPIAKKNNIKIISNYEIVNWFGNKGVEGHPLNHGGKASLDFGTVKYVNAIHTSGLPDGSYGGNPGGFVVWNDDSCFYFAGDTALTRDMELIPMTCPKLDFAILPIGDNFTMGYDDAIIASDMIQCDIIIGAHYDTFPYIEIDSAAAQKAFADKGKTLLLPKLGETIEL
jgi:L-ascorbate metabolism protein UlaG (beta-lactamase superfamily)